MQPNGEIDWRWDGSKKRSSGWNAMMLTAWPVFISFLAELQLAAAQLVIFFGSIPLKVSGSRLPPLLVVGPDDCRVCSSRSTHAPNTTNNCNTPSSLSGKLCDCNVEKLG